LILGLGALVVAPAAFAHADAGWFHRLTDGLSLFAMSVQYLLPVLSVALLAGRQRRPRIAFLAGALALGLLIGLFGVPWRADHSTLVVLARGYLVVLGLLVLADMRLDGVFTGTLCLLAGGLIGLERPAGSIADPLTVLLPNAGFVAAAVVLFVLAGLLSHRCRVGWKGIAVRVAGSWIAAIALLDLAFLIRPPG
jgi:hypothetical protein